jgi:spermidine/putrescine transport system permease protein
MAVSMLSAAERRRPWILLAPTLAALVLLMLVPIGIMFAYTFYKFQTAGVETPDLNLGNWHEFFSDPYYHGFLWKTARVSVITALLCAVMGYPPAYFIAMTQFRHKWLLLLLLIVPFWISFTIRTFSWVHILGEQGIINASLKALGLTEGSVIMGMIHFLLPYTILNVYASLEGIDRNLISAARSLGCTNWQAFKEVTLPLSLPGLGAGLLLSFVLAAGSYVTPQILGGRRDSLFGNLIFDTIMKELNWPMGTTLSVVLLVLLGIVSVIYSRYMGLSTITKGLSR